MRAQYISILSFFPSCFNGLIENRNQYAFPNRNSHNTLNRSDVNNDGHLLLKLQQISLDVDSLAPTGRVIFAKPTFTTCSHETFVEVQEVMALSVKSSTIDIHAHENFDNA